MKRRHLILLYFLSCLLSKNVIAQDEVLPPVDISKESIFTDNPVRYLSATPANPRLRNPPPATRRNLRASEIRHLSLRNPQQNLLRSLRSCGLQEFSLSAGSNRNFTCRAHLDFNISRDPQEMQNRVRELDALRWNFNADQKSSLEETCVQLIQRESLSAPRAMEQFLEQNLGAEAQFEAGRDVLGNYDRDARTCSMQPLILLSLTKRDPGLNSPRVKIECRSQETPQQVSFASIGKSNPDIERRICERTYCTDTNEYVEHCNQMRSLIQRSSEANQINLGNVQKILMETFRDPRGALFLPLYVEPQSTRQGITPVAGQN